MNRNEARRPAIFQSNGTTFGLLSYTSVFWPIGQAASEKNAGVATVKIYTAYEPHRRLFEMPGATATTLTHPDEKECEEIKNDIIEIRKKWMFWSCISIGEYRAITKFANIRRPWEG